MRILLDTNVVLDVLLDRRPHAEHCAKIWAAVENRFIEGLVAAHAITTIHYIARKDVGTARGNRIISALLRVFKVAPIDETILRDAIRMNMPDFEDAVAAAAAHAAQCDIIVTRDPRGFRGSPVRCLPPEAALPLLQQ